MIPPYDWEYTMEHDHHHHHADGSDCHCEPEAGDAVQPIDPVCGMSVDSGEKALTATHKGQTYYFCSPGCRTAFVANPQAYVS
jgi:P-type Cu+ transporter